MSKVNINKSEWLELVFEGKNKLYGAYQLRQEDDSTTIKAFFISILLLGSIITVFMLSSFTNKVEPIIIDNGPTIVPVILHPKTKVEPKHEKEAMPEKQAPKKDLPLTVAKAEDVKTEAPKNEDFRDNTPTTTTPSTNSGGTGPAIVIPTPSDPSEGDNGEGIKRSFEVDKNPMFPGGMDKFLKEVGNKFKTPEVEVEQTIRVIVFFVVEKDGSLSNITVPKNPGFGLGEEAIRVLKSIKTKWEPGMYKGKPVRTSFSLPIVVNIKTE
jgi:periplasmic protein TonB